MYNLLHSFELYSAIEVDERKENIVNDNMLHLPYLVFPLDVFDTGSVNK